MWAEPLRGPIRGAGPLWWTIPMRQLTRPIPGTRVVTGRCRPKPVDRSMILCYRCLRVLRCTCSSLGVIRCCRHKISLLCTTTRTRVTMPASTGIMAMHVADLTLHSAPATSTTAATAVATTAGAATLTVRLVVTIVIVVLLRI